MESSLSLNTNQEIKTETENTENNKLNTKYSKISFAQKDLLIKLYSEGISLVEAAKRVKINVKTAFSIIKKYKQNDYQLNLKKRGGFRHKKLNSNILQLIEKEVEHNPEITLKEIQKNLVIQNINLSISTINKGLTELKITLKLVNFQLDRLNSAETIEKRKEYAISFPYNVPENRKKIIFIDECGFNLHLIKSQARSKKGTSDNAVIPTVRGRNASLVVAMNNERIVHYSLVSAGTTNSDRFCTFIRELLQKLIELGLNESVLIIDNARIYKTPQVREILNLQPGFTLKYLPSYSPMLNPIGNAFSKIKTLVRSSLAEPGEHDLLHQISQAVVSITNSDCSNWFFDMLMKIGPAVAGEKIN